MCQTKCGVRMNESGDERKKSIPVTDTRLFVTIWNKDRTCVFKRVSRGRLDGADTHGATWGRMRKVQHYSDGSTWPEGLTAG